MQEAPTRPGIRRTFVVSLSGRCGMTIILGIAQLVENSVFDTESGTPVLRLFQPALATSGGSAYPTSGSSACR